MFGNKILLYWATMKIAVLTKAIPSYESSIRVDSSGKWIDETVVNYVVNESDSYA